MGKGQLPKTVLMKVLARSCFLQASWNFERLQSLGALYVLAPALRFFYRDQDDELKSSFLRHLKYFNTHPFMASPVLGATLSLEQARSRGEKTYLDVEEFRGMIMAPYAAMGDALFWGGIRPLAAGLALFFAARGSLWAPAVFFLVFNLPHLWFRIAGLLRGYSLGLQIIEIIQRRRLPDVAIRCKEGTVILLGGFCAYLAFMCLKTEGVPAGWGLLTIPMVIFLGWLARKGVSTLMLALTASAVILVVKQLNQFPPDWAERGWFGF